MAKVCAAFQMNTAYEAWNHLYKRSRVVARYGSTYEGKWLHLWDEGDRTLFQCLSCGGCFLVQRSSFFGQNNITRIDYFPVTGPDEAESLNHRWDGWQIENSFPERYLSQDEEHGTHWEQDNIRSTE